MNYQFARIRELLRAPGVTIPVATFARIDESLLTLEDDFKKRQPLMKESPRQGLSSNRQFKLLKPVFDLVDEEFTVQELREKSGLKSESQIKTLSTWVHRAAKKGTLEHVGYSTYRKVRVAK